MIRNILNRVMASGGTQSRGRGHRRAQGRRGRAGGGSTGARLGATVERFLRGRR